MIFFISAFTFNAGGAGSSIPRCDATKSTKPGPVLFLTKCTAGVREPINEVALQAVISLPSTNLADGPGPPYGDGGIVFGTVIPSTVTSPAEFLDKTSLRELPLIGFLAPRPIADVVISLRV